jgi:hypothetical protein
MHADMLLADYPCVCLPVLQLQKIALMPTEFKPSRRRAFNNSGMPRRSVDYCYIWVVCLITDITRGYLFYSMR